MTDTRRAEFEDLAAVITSSAPVERVDDTVVLFEAEVDGDPPRLIRLQRRVECDGRLVADATVLSFTLIDDDDDSQRCRDFMGSVPGDWAWWGRLASLLGPDEVVGIIRDEAEAAAVRESAEREAARLRTEREDEARLTIDSFLRDDGKRFGLTLQRRSDSAPLWTIDFREKWERERFRDWWRCQRHRFPEFAAQVAEHGALHLERMVLAEMLATEKDVRAAGLSAGGRRPLRFWRGRP